MEKSNKKKGSERSFAQRFRTVKGALWMVVGLGILGVGAYEVKERFFDPKEGIAIYPENGVIAATQVPFLQGEINSSKGSFKNPVILDAQFSKKLRYIKLGVDSKDITDKGQKNNQTITKEITIDDSSFKNPMIVTDDNGNKFEINGFNGFSQYLAGHNQIGSILEQKDPISGDSYFKNISNTGLATPSLLQNEEKSYLDQYQKMLKNQENVFNREYKQLSPKQFAELAPLKSDKIGGPKVFDGVAIIPIGTKIKLPKDFVLESPVVQVVVNPVITENGILLSFNSGEEIVLSSISGEDLQKITFIASGDGEKISALGALGSQHSLSATVFRVRGGQALFVNQGEQAVGVVSVGDTRRTILNNINTNNGNNNSVPTLKTANLEVGQSSQK